MTTRHGIEAEAAFNAIMRKYVIGTGYEYESQPDDLNAIYGSPPQSQRPHGIRPDAVIRSMKTRRAVFVEVKQQTVGNAHDRACRYFTPGIIGSSQVIANQPKDMIPFWWVFTGKLASEPGYVQEIKHWFLGVEGHLLLWQSTQDDKPVIDHFEQYIRPMLD